MGYALSDSAKTRVARQCIGPAPDAAPMPAERADAPEVRVERVGARLHVRSSGRALTEQEARTQSGRHLAEGERLLQCIDRSGTGPLCRRYTFVVWPKPVTHTGRLLRDLKAA